MVGRLALIGQDRVLRGGSWDSYDYDTRTTYRLWNEPGDNNTFPSGIRCARSP